MRKRGRVPNLERDFEESMLLEGTQAEYRRMSIFQLANKH